MWSGIAVRTFSRVPTRRGDAEEGADLGNPFERIESLASPIVLHPGDEGYEEEFRICVSEYERYGEPLLYYLTQPLPFTCDLGGNVALSNLRVE
ncbi:MAG TPA: hypothetical protein VKF37_17690 [Chloroflexota bacterium]|nr:hypothetical protein [Chloroflexota bacterium]